MTGIGSAMASPSRVMTGSHARLAHPGEPESKSSRRLDRRLSPGDTQAHTHTRRAPTLWIACGLPGDSLWIEAIG
jgi:hypothetical protein